MTIGKFETIEQLGSGHFGTVFRVTDTYLNVERALKIINAQDAQEFVEAFNEAQILERCKHNHIVEIKEIDVYNINGSPFPCITTEYLEKGSVQAYMSKKFLPVQKSLSIISDALLGLEHAHSRGILHRDVKPGNILLSNNNRGKLSDFGLAYGLASQPFDFAGYNSHLAPEVLNNANQDNVSDLYSMGVTLYRLLNNLKTLPIPTIPRADWIRAVEKERFPLRAYKSYIPDSIRRIVNKSMRANRNDRYQNCLEFRQAIQKIPLAVNWKPQSRNHWIGSYNTDNFEIVLYSKKRSGFFIDFKRNNRKLNEYCCEKITSYDIAVEEFFNTIRKTTLNV